MEFPELYTKTNPGLTPPECLIALDPGETTGLAIFKHGKLTQLDQLATHYVDKSVHLLQDLLQEHKPNMLVYEDYRVYAWKAQSHSWETLHTPRLIGCIQTLCTLNNVPYSTQMAQQAKNFCTDTKLVDWGYYKKGVRHARDAVRHGCYYLLFNHKKFVPG